MRSKIEERITLTIRFDRFLPMPARRLAIETCLRLVGIKTPTSHASKYQKLLWSAYVANNGAKSSLQNVSDVKEQAPGGAETTSQT